MSEITKNLFSYKGRWGRKNFLLVHLALLIILLPVAYFYNQGYPHPDIVTGIYIAIFLFLFTVSSITSAKRLQDMSYPGYWILVALALCYVLSPYKFFGYKPLLILYFYMAVHKGSPEENSFGPPLFVPKNKKIKE